jgi:UDP-N-acetylglucosamine 2-epimerase (non-hydrolysing)
MEEAAVIMVGLKKDRILQSLTLLEQREVSRIQVVKDYDSKYVSHKVISIILSYTDYVNSNVWKTCRYD